MNLKGILRSPVGRPGRTSELLYSDGCNTVRVAIGNTSLSTLLEVVR